MSEEANALITNGSTTTLLARKSWTAYAGTVLLAVFLLLIVTPAIWRSSVAGGAAVLVLALAFLAYRFLLLRSYQLYADEGGVWLYSGVLPWSKGVMGVKWRDIDEAVFFQSIWSWMFRSYTVRVGHRFTKSSEIVVTHMAGGQAAVQQVNTFHQELLRDNRLT